MARIQPIEIRDFSTGIVQDIDNALAPRNSVLFSINFLYHKIIGRAVLRQGTSLIGSQIVNNNPVLGLYNHRDTTGSNHAIFAVVSDGTNNDIYKGETWAKSLEDDTKGLKTRFETYLGQTVRLNGTDAPKAYNGSTWLTTGGVFDLANMPNGKYVLEWKDKIHVWGNTTYPHTLYESSIVKKTLAYDGQTANFTIGKTLTGGTSGATGIIVADDDQGTTGTLTLEGVTGTFQNNETITDNASTPGSATANGTLTTAVSWTSDNNAVEIEPEEGAGDPTALAKVPGYLLIFKERSLHRWNGTSSFTEELINLGTPSQESVVSARGSVYYFSAGYKEAIGFYRTNGGYPEKISRPVQDIVDLISSSFYTNVAGVSNGEWCLWSIGDITYNNITYNNVCLLFDIDTQTWAALSFPTEFRVFAPYVDSSGNLKILAGNDDGEVVELFTGTSDNYTSNSNVPIEYTLQTFSQEIGNRGMMKDISRMVIYTKNATNAKFMARTDEEGDFTVLDTVKSNFHDANVSLSGHIFEFGVSGSTAAGSTEIIGFDLYYPNISPETVKR